MKGELVMKILKIEDNKGFFKTTEDEGWKQFDEIDKDQLLGLLNLYLSNEVQMDCLEVNTLSNQVHKIIYQSVFKKLESLKENRSKFKDESDRTYLSAIQKYSSL